MQGQAIVGVHRGHREIDVVVGVGACPILAHGHAGRQISRLQATVHSGLGRIQDVELPRCIERRAENLVAASTDDQKSVTGRTAVNRDEVITKGSVETGWRLRGFDLDLVVQIDVLGRHLAQSINIHIINKRLYVHVEHLRGLGLGTDIGQIETIPTNQSRGQLIGKHPLRVSRVDGVVYVVRVGAEDQGVGRRRDRARKNYLAKSGSR